MKNLKRFFSIFLCFVVLITAFTVHSSAFAVTVASGTYVAYSILVAALAACGVAVAASNVSPGTFQSILDSPGAEDVKALIGATAVLANSGSTYFHWTASEWATFTSWVTGSGMLEGTIQVPASNPNAYVPSTSFNDSLNSSYYTAPTYTSTGNFAWTLGACTISLIKGSTMKITGQNCYCNIGTSRNSTDIYYLGSPAVVASNNSGISIYLAVALNNDGQVARYGDTLSGSCSVATYGGISNWYILYNGSYRYFNLSLNSTGINAYSSSYGRHYLTGTSLYPNTYTSLTQYLTDVINTGTLVGDLGWSTGIGDDVINPGNDTDDVGIDVYPPIAIPLGRNALPLDLGQGESIDIPLDPYLDRQTVSPGQDVIISNPPEWTDTVIDNPPDVVQPDVRVNPTTDVPPGTVDVPWSDEQTWPVAYPQTQTGELEESPPWEEAPPTTQNKPRENTNRMKLSAIWLSKFPFCIPWDLKQGVSQLLAPAEAPVFDIPFKNARLGINENIHIDFSQYESVASVSRWFFSACWVVILIMLTKKMIWK